MLQTSYKKNNTELENDQSDDERDLKSWELCNWNEDYDSEEIKREDLRNPNFFSLNLSF